MLGLDLFLPLVFKIAIIGLSREGFVMYAVCLSSRCMDLRSKSWSIRAWMASSALLSSLSKMLLTDTVSGCMI